jgi:hypothetical protein
LATAVDTCSDSVVETNCTVPNEMNKNEFMGNTTRKRQILVSLLGAIVVTIAIAVAKQFYWNVAYFIAGASSCRI